MMHRSFARALSGGSSPRTDGRSVYYVGLADTAALIRTALADAFPGRTFYVRSKSYSMGSSINVSYDGAAAGAPTWRDVSDLLGAFSGHSFDGSIDLGYSVSAWLTPDGIATAGYSLGTVGSHGSHPGYDFAAPSADAILVRFGAGYVFVTDDLPYDVRSKGAA